MTRRLEFFYDFRSPYSYLALTQLVQMDVDIVLRPISVLKVMEIVGNVPTTITCPTKGRYARTDLARWAGRYGVTINPSDMRANDGDACSRAVLAANPEDASFITLTLYRTIWSEKKPLTNAADAVGAIAAAGFDPLPIAARIDSAEVAAKLEANTNEAAARGVFGAPTMFVGEAMFFGNDRLEFVREELVRLETAA